MGTMVSAIFVPYKNIHYYCSFSILHSKKVEDVFLFEKIFSSSKGKALKNINEFFLEK